MTTLRPSRTIPEKLTAEVLERLKSADPSTGKPYTSRAVAAWLLDTHGVKCSHRAVLRAQAAADERGDALIVAALREELRDAVAPAKARLLRAAKRLDALTSKSKSVKDIASATNALTRALHELAHLGGVAAPLAVDVTTGGKPLPDARAALAQSLARLAEESEPDRSGEAPREPE